MPVRDCHICGGEHDQQVHDATKRVRMWFRGYVRLALTPVTVPKVVPRINPQQPVVSKKGKA